MMPEKLDGDNMAKITNYIPEPKEEYDVNNQRQILESLDSMKQQLNFSFQQDLKNEQDAFNYFLSWVYFIKIKVLNNRARARIPYLLVLQMEQL